MKTKESGSGFTLIELLVVVAIIGILVSLLFPAISSIRNSARKSAAKADMQSIETAIDQYYAEYRRLPIPDAFHETGGHTWRGLRETSFGERLDIPGGGWHHNADRVTETDSGQLAICAIATLQGSNEFRGKETGFNPRETEFLQRQEGRPLGHFMDPWSKGFSLDDDPDNRQYQLLLDHNLNEVINVAEIRRVYHNKLIHGKRVVVRCMGPNRKIEGRITDPAFDDLYSIDLDNL